MNGYRDFCVPAWSRLPQSAHKRLVLITKVCVTYAASSKFV